MLRRFFVTARRVRSLQCFARKENRFSARQKPPLRLPNAANLYYRICLFAWSEQERRKNVGSKLKKLAKGLQSTGARECESKRE